MLNKHIDAKMNLSSGAEGAILQGAQGVHAQDAQGTHVHGAQGVHVQGAQGKDAQGAQVKWQDDFGAERRLTLPQKRVLEQLAIWLRGEEKIISRIYRRIGEALGMSQRAARVHVAALKKKGLILSTVAYRPNSRQRIGALIRISTDAPIKHLPHKLSDAELLEMKEKGRKDAQVMALLRQGYSYIKELDGFVREPPI